MRKAENKIADREGIAAVLDELVRGDGKDEILKKLAMAIGNPKISGEVTHALGEFGEARVIEKLAKDMIILSFMTEDKENIKNVVESLLLYKDFPDFCASISHALSHQIAVRTFAPDNNEYHKKLLACLLSPPKEERDFILSFMKEGEEVSAGIALGLMVNSEIYADDESETSWDSEHGIVKVKSTDWLVSLIESKRDVLLEFKENPSVLFGIIGALGSLYCYKNSKAADNAVELLRREKENILRPSKGDTYNMNMILFSMVTIAAENEDLDLVRMVVQPLYSNPHIVDLLGKEPIMGYLIMDDVLELGAMTRDLDRISVAAELISELTKDNASYSYARDAVNMLVEVTKFDARKEIFDYYAMMMKNARDKPSMIEYIKEINDVTFINAAYANRNNGSLDPGTYMVVRILYLLDKSIDLNSLFSDRKLAKEAMFRVLERFGFDPSLLTEGEKVMLVLSFSGISEEDIATLGTYKDHIMKFLHVRGNDCDAPDVLYGWNNSGAINVTREFGRINIGKSGYRLGREQKLEMIRLLVLGINGSRDRETHGLALKNLGDMFGSEKAKTAFDAWAHVRSRHIDEMKTLYREFKAAKTSLEAVEIGYRIIEVFRKGLKGIEGDGGEALADILNMVKGGLDNDEMDNGLHAVFYTVRNKANALSISSDATGCCAFLPYDIGNMRMIRYAIDPAVILLNVALERLPLRDGQPLEGLEAKGVAICALGKFVEAGTGIERKVVYVDSLEAGLALKNALDGRTMEVVDILKEFSRLAGAEYVAFSTMPKGVFPSEFVGSISTDESTIALKLPLSEEQFFEGIKGKEEEVRVKLFRV